MPRVCAPGGIVSVLAPSTDFTYADLDALIETLERTGFSRAVVTKWHRGPTNQREIQLGALFRSVDLGLTVTRTYLAGMLIAAAAIVGSN